MVDNPELEYIAEAYSMWKKISFDMIPDSPKLLQALLIFDSEVESLREAQRARKDM